METNFQTSFIPKKSSSTPESSHSHSSVSVFMIISTLIFIASIAAAGFTFVAKGILMKSQEQAKQDLKANVDKFDLPLIESLRKANAKIDLAKGLLKNHLAVSEIFNIISKLTIQGVRFSSFEFTATDTQNNTSSNSLGSKVLGIKMKGMANSYNSVAFQSDVFGSSIKYGTNKVLKNPVLSDLAVDDKGNVTFNFTAELSQPDISYQNVLNSELQTEGVIPAGNTSSSTNSQ